MTQGGKTASRITPSNPPKRPPITKQANRINGDLSKPQSRVGGLKKAVMSAHFTRELHWKSSQNPKQTPIHLTLDSRVVPWSKAPATEGTSWGSGPAIALTVPARVR